MVYTGLPRFTSVCPPMSFLPSKSSPRQPTCIPRQSASMLARRAQQCRPDPAQSTRVPTTDSNSSFGAAGTRNGAREWMDIGPPPPWQDVRGVGEPRCACRTDRRRLAHWLIIESHKKRTGHMGRGAASSPLWLACLSARPPAAQMNRPAFQQACAGLCARRAASSGKASQNGRSVARPRERSS
jgi:hypothetical protein